MLLLFIPLEAFTINWTSSPIWSVIYLVGSKNRRNITKSLIDCIDERALNLTHSAEQSSSSPQITNWCFWWAKSYRTISTIFAHVKKNKLRLQGRMDSRKPYAIIYINFPLAKQSITIQMMLVVRICAYVLVIQTSNNRRNFNIYNWLNVCRT